MRIPRHKTDFQKETLCPRKLIQNYALDERKNEVNGSNNEINQSYILLILFIQGLKVNSVCLS